VSLPVIVAVPSLIHVPWVQVLESMKAKQQIIKEYIVSEASLENVLDGIMRRTGVFTVCRRYRVALTA
jgi:hypothetical protein